MARYIDADELLNRLPDDLPYKASVKRVLIQAPEADVVPKSEHERLAKEFESLETLYNEKVGQVKQLKEDIEGYRAELESEHLSRMDNIRELRAEIERSEHILNCYDLQYGTVMDKHIVIEKAKAEVAREIFEEIEREIKNHGITYAQRKIAELKKKYTEE